jgi:hypothetical protein
MNEQKNRFFQLFSKEISDSLILRGFSLIDKRTNEKFPQYNKFFFENTKEFMCAFYEEQVKLKDKKNKSNI